MKLTKTKEKEKENIFSFKTMHIHMNSSAVKYKSYYSHKKIEKGE